MTKSGPWDPSCRSSWGKLPQRTDIPLISLLSSFLQLCMQLWYPTSRSLLGSSRRNPQRKSSQGPQLLHVAARPSVFASCGRTGFTTVNKQFSNEVIGMGWIVFPQNSYEWVATRWCPTLCDPITCSPPESSVPGILQARILELVAIPFSRGIFLTQESNPYLLPALQVDSLLPEPAGRPIL